jgi:DNA-binding MarR family transcriptional regulator
MESNEIKSKQDIFGSIFLLANKFQLIGDRELEELSFKQLFLLIMINSLKDEPSLTDIAGAMGTSRQNIKKMLVILEKKGYVTLNTLPRDRKSLRASLTSKCNDYFQEHEQSSNVLLEKVFINVKNEELKAISETFTIMLENVDAILETKD